MNAIKNYGDMISALPFNKEANDDVDIMKLQKKQTTTMKLLIKKTKKQQIKCSIILYNSEYNKFVITNIGTMFFKLIRKHFLMENKLLITVNKSDVKISYN